MTLSDMVFFGAMYLKKLAVAGLVGSVSNLLVLIDILKKSD